MLREKPWRPDDWPPPLPHLVVVPDDEDPEAGDPRLTIAVVMAALVVVLISLWPMLVHS